MAGAEAFPHPTRAGSAPPSSRSELDRIPGLVAGLRASFDAGRTRPLAWRREQLEGVRALLGDHGDEFVAALHADLRKPTLEAWAADVGATRQEARLALRNLKKWTRPERVGLLPIPGRAKVIREPLGVVLIIAPWNYPVQLLLSPLIGAIAAGNCAVLKPSEVTPTTSALIARILPEYLDPDAIAVVEGAVDETTALLGERFDHIFYTGNGRVARVVMEAAAKNLTPVTLELGGKSPCIVDENVDVAIAARRIAWGKFMNAGQTCIAPDYVLVHESREEELLGELGAAVSEFFGPRPQATPDYARVVNRRHHRRLAALLKDGEVVVGGETDEDDCYIAPTVLRNVSPDSHLMADEIFGPILPVLRVGSIAEAIDFVNAREKPLALYVFTRNGEVEREVLERTSSGGVCVNATILHLMNPEMPFGGVGPSGIGAYHGRHSFETFSHRKSVLSLGLKWNLKLMFPPYTSFRTRMVKRFL